MAGYKRKYKRKRGGRNRRRRSKTMQMSSLGKRLSPFPTRFFTRLRYTDNYSLNPGASAVPGTQVMQLNGLYDPDISGVGHQPRYFDQIMSLYNQYAVLSAKITCTAVTRTGNTYNQVFGIAFRQGTSAATTLNDYIEQSDVVWRVLPEGASSEPKRISRKASMKQLLGRNPLTEDNLHGTDAANPAEGWYAHIFAAPLQAVDAANVELQCTMEFVVCFLEPKPIGQS